MSLLTLVWFAICAIVHELGHFLVGHGLGCKVTRFQIFLSPLYSFRFPPRKDGKPSWRDTEFSIGWLPLAGLTVFDVPSNYTNLVPLSTVNPYGTAEENEGKYMGWTKEGKPVQVARRQFLHLRPAWQRLCVSLAGVIFNLLFALLLMGIMVFCAVSQKHGVWGFAELKESLLSTFQIFGYSFLDASAVVTGLFGFDFSISQVSQPIYDIYQFLYAHSFAYGLAIYSIVLFFINILPIYPLDGGHAVFEIYEIITGKQPPQTVRTVLSWVGSILFIILFWILPMLR